MRFLYSKSTNSTNKKNNSVFIPVRLPRSRCHENCTVLLFTPAVMPLLARIWNYPSALKTIEGFIYISRASRSDRDQKQPKVRHEHNFASYTLLYEKLSSASSSCFARNKFASPASKVRTRNRLGSIRRRSREAHGRAEWKKEGNCAGKGVVDFHKPISRTRGRVSTEFGLRPERQGWEWKSSAVIRCGTVYWRVEAVVTVTAVVARSLQEANEGNEWVNA